MTDKVILFKTKGADTVSVRHPIGDTVEDCLEKLKKEKDDLIYYAVISKNNIPEDRYFRNAWNFDDRNKCVMIEVETCKTIHIDKLRYTRNKKLKELDTETVKAVGRGDDKKRDQIEREKQKLRDMPETMKKDLCQINDPDLIKACIPDCLK